MPNSDAHAARPPAWGPIAIAAFVGLVVCSKVADLTWAGLLDGNAGWLLALSSRNRYLVLALGADLSIPAYYVIASLRLTAAYAVCYALGYAYGDVAVGWFFRFLGTSRESVDQFNEMFRKAEWFLIPFFVGSNIVAALAGLHRTPPRKLIPLFALGLIGRLTLVWWLSVVFEVQLTAIVNFITSNQRWFIIGSLVLVVAANIRNFGRGSREG